MRTPFKVITPLGAMLATLCISSAFGATLATPPAQAHSVTYNLDIPAQDLNAALQQLALTLQHKLFYKSELVEGKTSAAVRGEYTTEQALRTLLDGTNLTYDITPSAVVLIRDKQSVSMRDATGSDVSSPVNVPKAGDTLQLRLAQAGPAASEDKKTTESSNKDAQGKVEEIVVTAQRREEKLQKVPMSISVLSGVELDQSNSQGVIDALRKAPGVALYENFQTGGASIHLRGVGAASSFSAGTSPVAFYLDSVPFGFVKSAIVPEANAYDMERVEVLRGPQGTIYGANAQAGVVRVLTKDANLSRMEFKTRVSGSQTQDGGGNYRADVAGNLPLIEGKLAARGVIGYQKLSGWIDRPTERDANHGEIKNFRLKVNGAPSENLTIGFSSWLSRSDFSAPPNGTDELTHRGFVPEPVKTDYDSFGLKVSYDFSRFTLTSSTSYLDYTLLSDLDTSFNGTNVLATNLDADVKAQEIQLTSTTEGSWRWSLGGMYRDASDGLVQLRRNIFTGAPQNPYVQAGRVVNTSKSLAAFGELTRKFMDGSLELTGGLRYFTDEVGQAEVVRFNSFAPPTVATSRDFTKTSPRLVLTWYPAETLTTYASYSEGFRSGSDQNPAILEAAPSFGPAKPDNLKNYEVGFKGSFFGGRLAVDSAAYYMDWQDPQSVITVQIGTASFTTLINSTSASGAGFDFGLMAQPVDALTLDLNFSVNDLKQDETVRQNGVDLFHPGDRLNLSAKYTAGASANYVFDMGTAGYKVDLGASANFHSKRGVHTLSGTTIAINEGDSILTSNVRVALEAPRNWIASVFVDNLNNEQGTPVIILAIPDWRARIRPRTFGVQFEYRY